MDRFSQWLDMQRIVTGMVEFLPMLVAAIAVMAGFLLLYRVTRIPIRAALGRTRLHEKLVELLVDSVYRYVLFVFGVVMGLDQLGVNVGAALAGIGVAGIAVGFAAQDSIANVISGFVIFWDEPFIVGSWIRVGDDIGQVTDITLRTTRIRTNRNTYVVIPNKNIIDTTLENFSQHGEMRIDVPLGIAYKESIPEARRVILAALERLEWVRHDPAPDVVVEQLGSSSVDLLVRVWVDDPADRPRTLAGVLEASKLALDAAGIQIPYPHLQLFVDDVRERVWERLGPALAAAPRDAGNGGTGRAG